MNIGEVLTGRLYIAMFKGPDDPRLVSAILDRRNVGLGEAMGGILIRQGDGTWLEPLEAGYGLESELQEILASHPELIPGVSSAAKTCREFQSDVGPADIVVVDSTGELTLVECKLASNPQIRREVVGQMFDYASRLWKMDVEEFAAKWQARTSHPFILDEVDGGILLRGALARNLADGSFRIVLAVDVINPALKRMIEYLNAMAGPGTSVIAVEYSRLRQGSVEILMPHVYGQELAEAKSVRNSREVTAWDDGTYRSWLQDHDSENLERFDFFLTTALAAGLTFAGSTSVHPAGSLPILSRRNIRLGTVSFFYFSGQGTSVEINLGRMAKLSDEELPDAEARDLFLQKLRDIPVLLEVAANLKTSSFASRKPNVPLSMFSKDAIQKAVDALGTLTGA
ncbi:hypothetical protein [Arthrobacter sp. SDTb3-6]|uniref:hypothetical protein n=1 Tax=Arthrobacter sp. SDTb3-6 TaxID=2713571 RepID=UPI00159D48F8|nr:hypothetical protein [Arthrobacter sp. SDTb3-6]NVN00513.1 hypothetical protein [Arthrobacter sp. SDTb3-6]